MKSLNLSQWAITHRALVLFMILVLGGAGTYAYLNLGRAEDPSFTIKVMIIDVQWPGASASEIQEQVADKIERKLQELPFLDRVEGYSRPGVAVTQVLLTDKTPPARVKAGRFIWFCPMNATIPLVASTPRPGTEALTKTGLKGRSAPLVMLKA